MKNLIVLSAAVALTIGSAIAAGTTSSTYPSAVTSSELIVSMADQELPFDRYWSKN